MHTVQQSKQQLTWPVALIALAIVGVGIWGLWKALDTPPKPQVTTYVATLGKYGVLDPKTVYVQVGVKNTGQVAHAASCWLSVTSQSGNYTGSSGFDSRELQPGKEETYTMKITVNDDGAAYITSGHAECVDR